MEWLVGFYCWIAWSILLSLLVTCKKASRFKKPPKGSPNVLVKQQKPLLDTPKEKSPAPTLTPTSKSTPKKTSQRQRRDNAKTPNSCDKSRDSGLDSSNKDKPKLASSKSKHSKSKHTKRTGNESRTSTPVKTGSFDPFLNSSDEKLRLAKIAKIKQNYRDNKRKEKSHSSEKQSLTQEQKTQGSHRSHKRKKLSKAKKKKRGLTKMIRNYVIEDDEVLEPPVPLEDLNVDNDFPCQKKEKSVIEFVIDNQENNQIVVSSNSNHDLKNKTRSSDKSHSKQE
ncbi:unnamed protein product [Bursaphelenchus okinawaensis]|uniref:Uncharacterized protein n=1 Tax=Bursaphelenchus okinawaensis TaxID=465554 RepID=A0A811LBH8_9BILA|nr:unnamed protein product [Bursaphelenchus okinawaensis]CAG9120286.1 unnamed protein product [Bursaphelenchus okinawaensis]